MPDYKNSKIYAIKSVQADKYYLGATTKRLCQRMAQHRQNYNKYVNKLIEYDSSFDVLQYSDAQIQLLESFECNNKDELNTKLQSYIESYKDKIANKAKERKVKEKEPKEPKEKKVKITKKKVLKEIELIPQPTNTPVVESDSDYETSEEKPTEVKPEEVKPEEVKPVMNIGFMNHLQALRAGLI